ncbi:hypothetical protein D6D15_09431 [Aureobasidium pullulans]|uniref:BTB domain-containing protein n=1 Tax=Aureobasidium pullulans TaxID=5580 RepID=A0A4S9AUB5_AURPU|nr:hypothetical protein D6D15_09431 [Aureobasidium pullulans]
MRKKRNFFNDEELSDVIIKFGEEQVFAHKVILASGSIWFEKALLGNFSEAKKKVVELHDDTGPDAITAMLKHLYGMSYETQIEPCEEVDFAELHHHVYLLGDKYDIESLRVQAAKKMRNFLSLEIRTGLYDKTISTIQKILGPEAVQFADRALELQTKKQLFARTQSLFRDHTFRDLLATGKMLAPKTAMAFLDKIESVAGWDDDFGSDEDSS